jgi:hypothetical protein
MGLTLAQARAKAGGNGDRWGLVNSCKNAAAAGAGGAAAFGNPNNNNVAYFTYPCESMACNDVPGHSLHLFEKAMHGAITYLFPAR